jgi:hypothetical protein
LTTATAKIANIRESRICLKTTMPDMIASSASRNSERCNGARRDERGQVIAGLVVDVPDWNMQPVIGAQLVQAIKAEPALASAVRLIKQHGTTSALRSTLPSEWVHDCGPS